MHIRPLLSLVFIAIISLVDAQTSARDMLVKMGRGINLGNTLSAPIEGNWAPAVQESYFEDVAAVGFTNVRIPIRFDLHTTALSEVNYKDSEGNYTGSISDYQVDPSYLERIDEVTGWALDNKLVAIIDVHGDHWFWESYDPSSSEYKTGADRQAAEDRFRAIWTAISTKFQDAPDELLFEIMNEAYFSMSAAEVNAVNSDILSIIRATNPNRNVIVTGGGKNSWEAPQQLDPAFLSSDNYLIATFHYYKPGPFTRSSRENLNQFEWGSIEEKNEVDAHFDAVKNWAITTDMPVYLGEFGADNANGYNYATETDGEFGGPTKEARVEYHRFIAEAAIERGFSFSAWDAGHKSNKTIYNVSNRSWVTDVRNALLAIDCLESGIIKNADIECGFDSSWEVLNAGASAASIDNANDNEVRSGKSLVVNVSSSEAAFNNVILRNEVYDSEDLSGKFLTISSYAKASSDSQQFKFRIKAIVEGVTQLTASQTFSLSSDQYQKFIFDYQVPANTSSLQLQLLVGKQLGSYFFDDFTVTEDQTLGLTTRQPKFNDLKIYPNPVRDVVTIDSNKPIKGYMLYDINGKNHIFKYDRFLDFSEFSNGVYILKIIFEDQTQLHKKLIINH